MVECELNNDCEVDGEREHLDEVNEVLRTVTIASNGNWMGE